MKLLDSTVKILNLAKVIYAWQTSLGGIGQARREAVAEYCENIAAALGRTTEALVALAADPNDRKVARDARREFGRLTGYVEDIAALLEGHLDGRKIAGVKRRLEALTEPHRLEGTGLSRVNRLSEAEGYFRSLSDRLRT